MSAGHSATLATSTALGPHRQMVSAAANPLPTIRFLWSSVSRSLSFSCTGTRRERSSSRSANAGTRPAAAHDPVQSSVGVSTMRRPADRAPTRSPTLAQGRTRVQVVGIDHQSAGPKHVGAGPIDAGEGRRWRIVQGGARDHRAYRPRRQLPRPVRGTQIRTNELDVRVHRAAQCEQEGVDVHRDHRRGGEARGEPAGQRPRAAADVDEHPGAGTVGLHRVADHLEPFGASVRVPLLLPFPPHVPLPRQLRIQLPRQLRIHRPRR